MTDAASLIERAGVHEDWREILQRACASLDPEYIRSLQRDERWLPGSDRLLAAFRRDRRGVRYLLLGESPFPRRESANGIAFYDAAVSELWSEAGLSKALNRATSLRNIIKTALLAEGLLRRDADGKITQDAIAGLDKATLIQTLPELFHNLEKAGFLMLNATPVLHPARKPAQEAAYWRDFLQQLLGLLAQTTTHRVTLVLWGRIARLVTELPASSRFDQLVCEHPYNISFIDNPAMLALFARLRVLQKAAVSHRKQ